MKQTFNVKDVKLTIGMVSNSDFSRSWHQPEMVSFFDLRGQDFRDGAAVETNPSCGPS